MLDWLIEHTGDKANWIVVATVAVIAGFSYCLGMAKNRAEITHLKTQIIDSVLRHEMNEIDAHRRYAEQQSRCCQFAKQLGREMKEEADETTINHTRESFCECLCKETMLELYSWVTHKRADLDAHANGGSKSVTPDHYSKLLTDTIEELRRFRSWIDIINHPAFTVDYGLESLKLEARSIEKLVLNVERFPPSIRNVELRRVREEITKLTTLPTGGEQQA